MKKKVLILSLSMFGLLSTNTFIPTKVLATTAVEPNENTAPEEELDVLYERVYDNGYALGESDGYSGEKFISFDGNNQLAAYPSEAASWFMLGYSVGFESGKRSKTEEEKTEKETDYSAGEKAGYEIGIQDYENATVAYTPPTMKSKSADWNEGFTFGYEKAIETMDLSVKAREEGYLQGVQDEAMSVPELYTEDPMTQKAFEEGFQKAMNEKEAAKNVQYEKDGYKLGYSMEPLVVPDGLTPAGTEAFTKGYNKGEKKRLEDVKMEGFNAAFLNEKYKVPKVYEWNVQLLEVYQQGFVSNKKAAQFKKQAYQDGWKLGTKMDVPAAYKKNKAAVTAYKEYYQLGQEKQEKTVYDVLIALGILLSGIGLFRVIRKRKKKGDFSV
ncbi:hypothetical protein ABEP17_05960 [Priestia flexa]|uniref:hypothetical protein n=1 Tax=Priestia flexa TaxID=86664 RepID=UPI003D27B075